MVLDRCNSKQARPFGRLKIRRKRPGAMDGHASVGGCWCGTCCKRVLHSLHTIGMPACKQCHVSADLCGPVVGQGREATAPG